MPFEGISEAPELFRRLAAAGLGKDAAGTIADVVSCPGESAAAFFARVEVERAQVLLQDLGELSADTAHADDYVDPGEEAAGGAFPLRRADTTGARRTTMAVSSDDLVALTTSASPSCAATLR